MGGISVHTGVVSKQMTKKVGYPLVRSYLGTALRGRLVYGSFQKS